MMHITSDERDQVVILSDQPKMGEVVTVMAGKWPVCVEGLGLHSMVEPGTGVEFEPVFRTERQGDVDVPVLERWRRRLPPDEPKVPPYVDHGLGSRAANRAHQRWLDAEADKVPLPFLPDLLCGPTRTPPPCRSCGQESPALMDPLTKSLICRGCGVTLHPSTEN